MIQNELMLKKRILFSLSEILFIKVKVNYIKFRSVVPAQK
jgi:hypothetical protein